MAKKTKKKKLDGWVGHTDELCPWIHIDESACGYSCVSTNKRKRKSERERRDKRQKIREPRQNTISRLVANAEWDVCRV